MSHLEEVQMGYFQHLKRAWTVAGVLLVHGIFPNIWKHKASNMICQDHMTSTRKHLLKHHGISVD
jgi:hypothetical protein